MALKTTVQAGSITEQRDELIVVDQFEGLKVPEGATGAVDRALGGAIRALIASGDITGKARETVVIPLNVDILPGQNMAAPPEGGACRPSDKKSRPGSPATGVAALRPAARRIMIAGLGKREEFGLDTARDVSAGVALKVREMGLPSYSTAICGSGEGGLTPGSCASAMVEGAALGLFRYIRFRSPPEGTPRSEVDKAHLPGLMTIVESDENLVPAIRRAVKDAMAVSRAANAARELACTPGNSMTPSDLASWARSRAKELSSDGVRNLSCIVMGEVEMGREGMGGVLAVAKGSVEHPRFITIEYNMRRKGHPLVLVGKGVTFDSGGISIKPTEGTFPMWEMKDDMTGAAAVINAVLACAQLGLPRKLVALAPCVENMPSGRALKPGDVVKAYNGVTIEIQNTDAEGRLILADALAYSERYGPASLVDVATLTGSAYVALGTFAAAVMGNDQGLVDTLIGAGERTGERLWQLPLWDDYERQIKSDIADVRNVGGKPAGAITGGMFLKRFVPGGVPWAHIDIGGMSWNRGGSEYPDKNYVPKGPTGFGVRLLVDLIRGWKGGKDRQES